jgi:hypothetical protein
MRQLQSSQKETPHNYGEHLLYLIKILFTAATLPSVLHYPWGQFYHVFAIFIPLKFILLGGN